MRSLCVLAGSILGAFALSSAAAATPLAARSLSPTSPLAAPTMTATARTPGIPLNVRAAADHGSAKIGNISNGSQLTIECHVLGPWIAGTVRTTNRWDRLSSGGYVSDAYVARPSNLASCAAAAPAPQAGGTTVAARTPGIPLNVRAASSANSAEVSEIANGAQFAVDCQVTGQNIAGTVRTTNRWDRLSSGGYVSDAYVARPHDLPSCSSLAPPAAVPPEVFLQSAIGPARQSRASHGVPVSVTLAQAILESGWGTSQLSRADHNLFGIKCFGWPGPIAVACADYKTSECAAGRCHQTVDEFRSYASALDSFKDHGRFLRVNERYAGAFSFTNNPDEFARAIAKAGYATDPDYGTKLVALMQRHNLYQYDA